MMQFVTRFARRSAPRLSSRAFSSGQWWGNVELGPKDPILGVTEAFLADENPSKLNLGVGAYRDEDGKPVVLGSVATASKHIVESGMNNEYSPISGSPQYVKVAVELAFGQDSAPLQEGRVAAVQALSGTGALRLLGEYFNKFWEKEKKIYVPSPTWGNHHAIYQNSHLEVGQYSYYDPSTCGLDFEGLVASLDSMEDQSIVLMHACAHNPTGVDPNPEQWKQISQLCKDKQHFVVFDSAYQGFASGSCERDRFAIEQFVSDGHQVGLCQSFSKNFGLYGQRTGTAALVVGDPEEKARVESQLKILARAMYSNPPIHGARIVEHVLSDDNLKQQWFGEVKEMADRIITMRTELRNTLEDLNQSSGTDFSWQHITDQIGMFCYSGLEPHMVDRIKGKHSVYLTQDGRISMAGVNSKCIDYLANAIHEVKTADY